MRPRVVIIGAGFAGLWLTRNLRRSPVDIVLIDKNNFHSFLPLLYQVAAAELEVSDIATPIRKLVSKQKNVLFLNDEVTGIDREKKVIFTINREIDYDYLVIAAGSSTYFYSTPGAEEHAFPLKEIADGLQLRNAILQVFEKSMLLPRDEQEKLLQFTIVGGGPTGVEYAGALSELIRGPLRKDFPGLPIDKIRITLVEGNRSLLAQFDPKLGGFAKRILEKKGVNVITEDIVLEVTENEVYLRSGAIIPSSVTIWTAGISGNPIARKLKLPTNTRGQILVDNYLRITEDIFAAGDIVALSGVPQVAPAAVQMGKFLAKSITQMVKGKELKTEFRYKDLGSMAVIGRYSAVVEINRLKLKGFTAWWLWIVLHLLKLITFRNKLFVLMRWGYSYLFFDKSVRYILPSQTTKKKLITRPKSYL